MTDRPITFSGPMVRALLEERKTQTRRVINPKPVHDAAFVTMSNDGRWIASDSLGYGYLVNVPHTIGDRLWVREAFVRYHDLDDCDMRVGPLKTAYKADGGFRWLDADTDEFRDNPPWKPSIHMPRWASRITLTVTDVRVQRLQDISEADAVAEGWPGPMTDIGYPISTPRQWFSGLWNRLHRHDAWDANPWVVALTFTVERRNIDAAKEAAE